MLEGMKEAAIEEKQHAIDIGSFHEEVPYIKVVCDGDGGWSKRSHKHTYKAASGVAIVVGAHTQKVLFVGVRSSRCATCRRADSMGTESPEHNCQKNWDKSAQAMEADIFLEGFQQAEGRLGIHYMKIVGDGDSSLLHRFYFQEHQAIQTAATGAEKEGHYLTPL